MIQQFLQAKMEWVRVQAEGRLGSDIPFAERNNAWLGTMVVRSMMSYVLEGWGSLLPQGYWFYPEFRPGAFLKTCIFPWPLLEATSSGEKQKSRS